MAKQSKPTIGGVPATTATISTGAAAALANITVADKNAGDTLYVTLAAVNGTIGGLSDIDAGTAGIQLSGTAAAINSMLTAATFTAAVDGAASIGISVSDGHIASPVTATYLLKAVTPNAGLTVDLAHRHLSVAAGATDVAKALAGLTLSPFFPTYIDDDGLRSSITGSLAADHFIWHGGNDSFNGGANIDSVRLFRPLGYGSAITIATDSQGNTLFKDGAATLVTIGAKDGTGHIRVASQDGTLNLKDVETLSFFAQPQDGGAGKTYTLNLATSADPATRHLAIGAGATDIASAVASVTPAKWGYVRIDDDSRDSAISGFTAGDILIWHGGNDSFDGGAGNDHVQLSERLGYHSAITVLTDSNGNVLFKDGAATLVSVGAKDSAGHSSVVWQGNSLILNDVEGFSFFAAREGDGDVRHYTLNLSPLVDPGNRYLSLGAGLTDIASALAGTTLAASSYVQIDDDSRDNSVTGSIGRDDLNWHGGNDSFDGGTGIDGAMLVDAIYYHTGITWSTDSDGTILFKDGAVTVLSVSAPDAAGRSLVAGDGISLALKDVETFSFHAAPQGGGAPLDYFTLNLVNSVDLANMHLSVGAGALDVSSALAGLTLKQSDDVSIDDDPHDSVITGSLANDRFNWHGGNDRFDGGAGTDSARSGNIRYNGVLTYSTDSAGNVMFQDSAATLLTLSVKDGAGQISVTSQGGTLRLKDVETFSFFAYARNGDYRNYVFHLDDTVAPGSKHLSVGAATTDVAGILAGMTLTPSDEVLIDDDARASAITGSIARDSLIWHGGSDYFDGGTGTDSVVLSDSINYGGSLTARTDSQGNTVFQNGTTTLVSVSATDSAGQTRISYRGDTLVLKNVETFSFDAHPQGIGAGSAYSLNLNHFVDPGTRHLHLGTGAASVADVLNGGALAQSDHVTIDDDLRASTITGSIARDDMTWHGGNDHFDGGTGTDSVVLSNSISYDASFTMRTDSKGKTVFKDGATTLVSVSATDSSGQTRISYRGDTLVLKNVETFSFYAYPEGGEAGTAYSFNLNSYVNPGTKHLQLGAGAASVAGLLNGVALARSDYVTIDDDMRDARITGSIAHDNFIWHGGNDRFDGRAGIDSVHVDSIVADGARIRLDTADGTSMLIADGKFLASIGDRFRSIEVLSNSGSLDLQGVETISFEVHSRDGASSSNWQFNLTSYMQDGEVFFGGATFNARRFSKTTDSTTTLNDDVRDTRITGTAHADRLHWAGGNDVFRGGAGIDTLVLNDPQHPDLVQTPVGKHSFTLSADHVTVATVTDTRDGVTVDWVDHGRITLVGVETLEYASGGTIHSIDLFP